MFQLIYYSGKAGKKLDALTQLLRDLFKVGDILDKRNSHQYHVIL